MGLEALSYVCAAGALVGLFYQTSVDSSGRRSEFALAHVQQYNSDPISGHRLNLDRAWLQRRPQLVAINRSGGIRPNDIADVVDDALAAHDRATPDQPATISVHEIAAFFDRTILCVDVGACDARLIEAYFRTPIREFWTTYRHLIIAARDFHSSGLGVNIERYLAQEAR